MPDPRHDPAAIEALRDVVTDTENLVESLTSAADTIDAGGYSPALAARLRAWALVLEAPRNDVNRIVNAAVPPA